MPKQLEHAVSVKYMPTLKLHASLFLELACVADSAVLLTVLTKDFLASWI